MKRLEPNAPSDEVESFLSGLTHDLRNLLEGVAMTLPESSEEQPARALQETTFRNIYDVLRKSEDFLDRIRHRSRGRGTADLASILARTTNDLRALVAERKLSLPDAHHVWVAADAKSLRRMIESVLYVLSKRTSRGDIIRLAFEGRNPVRLVSEVPKLATAMTQAELFSPEFKDGLDLWVARDTARSFQGDLVGGLGECGLRLVLTLPRGEPLIEAESSLRKIQRVLVVDDNLDSAQSLAILLSAAGFETELCGDGESALETLGSFEPDAVLLDLGLPQMDGFEVCRRIRRQPSEKSVLLLAVSGRGDGETLDAIRAAGFDDHFLKPVDHQRLLHRLRL